MDVSVARLYMQRFKYYLSLFTDLFSHQVDINQHVAYLQHHGHCFSSDLRFSCPIIAPCTWNDTRRRLLVSYPSLQHANPRITHRRYTYVEREGALWSRMVLDLGLYRSSNWMHHRCAFGLLQATNRMEFFLGDCGRCYTSIRDFAGHIDRGPWPAYHRAMKTE